MRNIRYDWTGQFLVSIVYIERDSILVRFNVVATYTQLFTHKNSPVISHVWILARSNKEHARSIDIYILNRL